MRPKSKQLSILCKAICCLLLTLLIACGQQEVVQKLSQEQAIQLVSRLNQAGVDASFKSGTGRGDNYSIFVAQKNYPAAMQLIGTLGIPENQNEKFEELTKQKGFVPNSRAIQALRLDRALALEVERLIVSLPDVIDAHVVIRNNLAKELSSPAKATVVLRTHSTVGDKSNLILEAEQIIKNVILGIESQDIQVKTSFLNILPNGSKDQVANPELESVFLLNFNVPAQQKRIAETKISALVVLGIVCGGIVGVWLGFFLHARSRPVRLENDNFFIDTNDKKQIELTDE